MTTTTIRLFKVGGCVRDAMLGVRTKDIDFAVEAASFDAMRCFLVAEGFHIFVEKPEFLTIRAKFPRGHQHERVDADFVLCRRDSSGSDGRRPDFVEPGTIFDDLARRDFTVNAMAIDEAGELLDPHDGQTDLASMTLRCVGDPMTRFREDGLRALRAIRFTLTKGFTLDAAIVAALNSQELPSLLRSVSAERRREELARAFAADTLGTMELIGRLPITTRQAIFKDGLRLKPTLEG